MAKINWKAVKKFMNQPVVIVLDDHAMGRDIVPCKCMGWLAEVTNKKVMLVHWDILTTCPQTRDFNIECTSLSKNSITDIFPLKQIKKWQ